MPEEATSAKRTPTLLSRYGKVRWIKINVSLWKKIIAILVSLFLICQITEARKKLGARQPKACRVVNFGKFVLLSKYCYTIGNFCKFILWSKYCYAQGVFCRFIL